MQPSNERNSILFGELPLQNETTSFILVNCLDIFMTYMLIRFGGIEANPIANSILQNWGFNGMVVFKLSIVSFVCVLSQVIALKKPLAARYLLQVGSLLVGLVVVYSAVLFFMQVTLPSL